VDDDDLMAGPRQVVMHPSTAAARRQAHVRAAATVHGVRASPADVADLLRRQRALAVRYGLVLLAVVALLPVILSMIDTPPPGWPAGWPAPAWFAVPGGALATFYLLASSHRRRAARLEDTWLAGHSETPEGL